MTDYDVPFNRPYLAGSELDLMRQAVELGHISGDGTFTARASELLAELTGSPGVLLTTSCTHALELAGLLLDLEPGDEVLMPSFTFVSTANAFALRGAVPVFVDIRPDTLNIDDRLIEERITSRTRAIVVVHYGGVACEMDEILAMAEAHGLAVVEDNAHGLGATYRGRPLGSLAAMATLSFHETKNIQCGEGGALLVNDERLQDRAEIIREKGTNRRQFFRGAVDKYTWVDIGSSFLPSDLLAAFLVGQLESRDDIHQRRMTAWERYAAELGPWAADRGVGCPFVPADRTHAAHLFHLLLPSQEERQRFIAHLAARRVQAVFHYVPLHSSPAGMRLGRTVGDCAVTSDVSERLVRLPLFAGLTLSDQDQVLDAVGSFPT